MFITHFIALFILFVCTDCDSAKSLLLCDVLAACERYHALPPFSIVPSASQMVMVSDLLDAIACEMQPVSSISLDDS